MKKASRKEVYKAWPYVFLKIHIYQNSSNSALGDLCIFYLYELYVNRKIYVYILVIDLKKQIFLNYFLKLRLAFSKKKDLPAHIT